MPPASPKPAARHIQQVCGRLLLLLRQSRRIAACGQGFECAPGILFAHGCVVHILDELLVSCVKPVNLTVDRIEIHISLFGA